MCKQQPLMHEDVCGCPESGYSPISHMDHSPNRILPAKNDYNKDHVTTVDKEERERIIFSFLCIDKGLGK